jgi:hypothetical protein
MIVAYFYTVSGFQAKKVLSDQIHPMVVVLYPEKKISINMLICGSEELYFILLDLFFTSR